MDCLPCGPIDALNGQPRATATVAMPTTAASMTRWGITFAATSAISTSINRAGWDGMGFRPVGDPPRYLYAGAEWIDEIGLYRMGARLYDPKTGTFLSQDPAPPTAGGSEKGFGKGGGATDIVYPPQSVVSLYPPMLNAPTRWERLTPEYQQHLVDYIENPNTGGFR